MPPDPDHTTGSPRPDVLGSLVLAAPVFLVYHLGLLVSPEAANGVDLTTRLLGMLTELGTGAYLLLLAVLVLIYLVVLDRLRRSGRFDPRRFPQVLVESTLYASLMGPVASLLLHELHLIGMLATMGPIDRVVASAGAGFYEELVFRLGGVGGGLILLRATRLGPVASTLVVVATSSLVFAGMHHLGPGAEPFMLASFSFRTVLGVMLATIYLARGFATAVYAHFLYDVYVMLFWM